MVTGHLSRSTPCNPTYPKNQEYPFKTTYSDFSMFYSVLALQQRVSNFILVIGLKTI